jgi:hypothetical protein
MGATGDGTGTYRCPSKQVAEEMQSILLGWLKEVVFALYSRPPNGLLNFAVFEETFREVKLHVAVGTAS